MHVNPKPATGSPLDWFDGTPRAGQVATLAAAPAAWPGADVLVVRAPVGAGKSRMAVALARWAGGATILTPTNNLLAQYTETWPDLPVPLYRADVPGTQAWLRHKAELAAAPVKGANYYSYLAHKLYSPTVIVDEAHRLVPMLQELEAITLWEHLTPWPHWIQTTADLLGFATSVADDGPSASRAGRLYAKLVNKLAQHPDTYTVRVETADYRGRPRRCLRLLPLTPRHNRPVLWPRRVKRLVFLSATFGAEDLYDLGLDARRVTVLDSPSPIPARNRPVVYAPVGSLGMAGRAASLPRLEAALGELLRRHPERGVIHATYGLAQELRAGALGRDPRLVWHSPDNAGRVLHDWLDVAKKAPSGDGRVLVACGMTEGIDLHGDRARWQAVCKLLYPDRSDPAVAAKLAVRPRAYAWSAARDVIQASGRVCRGPEDFGKTYILDADFGRLFAQNRDMFPGWFTEALEFTCASF